MNMAARRNELFVEVIDHARSLLSELGIEPERADQCAHALADMLCEHWGGQVIGIPKDHAIKLSAREREIALLHNQGVGKDVIARRYQITQRAVNRILHRIAARDHVDAQLDLFAG